VRKKIHGKLTSRVDNYVVHPTMDAKDVTESEVREKNLLQVISYRLDGVSLLIGQFRALGSLCKELTFELKSAFLDCSLPLPNHLSILVSLRSRGNFLISLESWKDTSLTWFLSLDFILQSISFDPS
jgi:hypothetical protein